MPRLCRRSLLILGPLRHQYRVSRRSPPLLQFQYRLLRDGPRGSLVVTVPHNLAFAVEITVRTDPRERR